MEGNIVAADGYMQVTEDAGISFHRVNLEIYSMTLRTDVAGVYYTSRFAGDEKVADLVDTYGVALSVAGEPTSGLKNCGYSHFSDFKAGEGANAAASGTLLTNVLKPENSDKRNTRNADMEIFGRAYLKTADGYVFGATVSYSLKSLVEAVDEIWNNLFASQRSAVAAMYKAYATVMDAWDIPNAKAYGDGSIIPGISGEITMPLPVKVENGKVAETLTVSESGISVTVAAGTALAEGAEGLTLKVTPLERADIDVMLDTNQAITPVDVHVEGISAENTVPLTINMAKILPENMNLGNYKTYHVENGEAKEMELLPVNQEFTAHNQYKYSLDGELTLHMATFSTVYAISDTNNYWQGNIDTSWYINNEYAKSYEIRNADQMAGLNKIVSGDKDYPTINSATTYPQDDFAGVTFTLISDIVFEYFNGHEITQDEHHKVWYPVGYWKKGAGTNVAGETWYTFGGGFNGHFNGNGHTINNIHQRTWDMDGDYDKGYWRAGMGFFGDVYEGSVKNLTIDNFYCDGEYAPTGCVAACAAGEATFENINVVNSYVGVYNNSAAGVVGYTDNYDGKPSNLTFRNITVDNTTTIAALWGTYDGMCAGILAGMRENTSVLLEKCHVGAKLDVFNDVCGNYQYYVYRGSGMLVGGIRKLKYVNGMETVDISGITTVDCTVDFSENAHYYCEFVKNGNPSYCNKEQDFKFSRVPNDDIKIVDGVATCNHDHTEKENYQAVYLPFWNLYAGRNGGRVYGIRNVTVSNKDEHGVTGVTITEGQERVNVNKFAPVSYDATYVPGSIVKLGDLFTHTSQYDPYGLGVNSESFYANAVSVETGLDVATFTPNKEDWTQSTLTFNKNLVGEVKITAQDYQYCVPATLTLSKVDFALDSNGMGYCVICGGEKVKWTPITTNGVTIADGASHHYYLASDVTDTQNYQQFIYMKTPASGSNKLCLNLNGYTLTTCRKITVESGHLNIIGGEDGKIVFTNPHGRNFDGINATGGTVNIYGGTYSYSVEEGQTKKAVVATSRGLTLRGATINGGIILSDTANAQVLLREATNIENISFVGTHGKVTVDTNWTGSANIALPADSFADGVVESRVVANGAFSGKLALSTGEPLKYESSQLVLDKTFNPANAKNYCEVCDGFFAWTALAADTVLDDTVAHHHVYLADNLSTDVDKYLARTKDSDVCFNTNGKTLTLTAGRLWNASGATINIFGGGTIHAMAKEAVNAVWSTTNVYDCTITSDAKNAIVSSSGSAVFNLYAGARVERVAMSQGVVNLYGDSRVDLLEIQASGKMAVQDGWSGKSIVYLNGVAMVNGVIPTTNATVAGAFTGTLTLEGTGEPLKGQDGALVIDYPDPVEGVFDPAACGGYAYCDACKGEPVLWTALTAETASNIEDGESHHYYLADNFDDAGTAKLLFYLKTNAANKLCLHLNGKTLTTGRKIVVDAGHMNLIGGENGKIVFDNRNNQTVNHYGINAGGGTVNIYGGTYTYEPVGDATEYAVISASRGVTIRNANIESILLGNTAQAQVVLREATNVDAITFAADRGKLSTNADWTGKATVTLPGTDLARLSHDSAATGELTVNCTGAKVEYCPVCKNFFAWTALKAEQGDLDHTVASHHYYLAGDVESAEAKYLYTAADGVKKICLNTNGNTLTLTNGYVYISRNTELNVFGGGTIKATGKDKPALYPFGCTLNLYDGSYLSEQSGAISSGSVYAKIHVYGDTHLTDTVTVHSGNITLHDNAKADRINLGGTGKLNIPADWKGKATVKLADGLLGTDGAIAEANAVAAGDFEGELIVEGYGRVYNENGRLALKKEFNPAYAFTYCEKCDAFATWEALKSTMGTLDTSKGTHRHFYLADDLTTDEENYLGRAKDVVVDVCLNTNGKTLTLTLGSVINRYGATMNIFGGGIIRNTAALPAAHLYGGTTNIYDCAFIGDNAHGITLAASNAIVNFYGNTYHDDSITLGCGMINLFDSVSARRFAISDSGVLNVDEAWTGTAGLANGDLLNTNVTCSGDNCKGVISVIDGESYNFVDGVLKPTVSNE